MSSNEVGYGKPPVHSRFQKVVSGNPSGRPKEKSSPMAGLAKILSRKLKVIIDGKPQSLTAFEVGMITLQKEMIKGNGAALRLFMQLTRDYLNHQEKELVSGPVIIQLEGVKSTIPRPASADL